jgi:hypothetical protein
MSRRMRSDEYYLVRLLRISPFERRRGGWRFGTRRIGESAVDRLLASGRVRRDGDRICLTGAKSQGDNEVQ